MSPKIMTNSEKCNTPKPRRVLKVMIVAFTLPCIIIHQKYFSVLFGCPQVGCLENDDVSEFRQRNSFRDDHEEFPGSREPRVTDDGNVSVGLIRRDNSITSSVGNYNRLSVEASAPLPEGKGKDSNAANGTHDRPVFLWGISSVYGNQDEERKRRARIRNTYLQYYLRNDRKGERHRVCSLYQALQIGGILPEGCQVIYAFIVGGNPSGRTELIEFNESYPFRLVSSKGFPGEEDVIKLNIRENQHQGKTQTWFAYGSYLSQQYPHWQLDYIVKASSETLLYIPKFLNRATSLFPITKMEANDTRDERPLLVYGGVPILRARCGRKLKPDCQRMIGEYFMDGQVEILSVDLARYIATNLTQQRRQSLEILSREDMTIGNFVHSHPEPIQGVFVENLNLWSETKENEFPGELIRFWVNYLLDQARMTSRVTKNSRFPNDTTSTSVQIRPSQVLLLPHTGESVIQKFLMVACAEGLGANRELCWETFLKTFRRRPELQLTRYASGILQPRETSEQELRYAFQLNPTEIPRSIVMTLRDPLDRLWLEDSERQLTMAALIAANQNSWSDSNITLQNLMSIFHGHLEVDQERNTQTSYARAVQLVHFIESTSQALSFQTDLIVLRTEFLWDDLVHFESQLGGRLGTEEFSWPEFKETPPGDHPLPKALRPLLCCLFQQEVASYRTFLQMAVNLDEARKQMSIDQLTTSCQVSSFDDLAGHCDRAYPILAKRRNLLS